LSFSHTPNKFLNLLNQAASIISPNAASSACQTDPRLDGHLPPAATDGRSSDIPSRLLAGSFPSLGFSLEWHDFESAGEVNWARCFHPDSVELCLNLSGNGHVQHSRREATFAPGTAGFYAQRKPSLKAWRDPAEHHQFFTVRFSVPFLRQQLAGSDGALHPLVEGLMREQKRFAGISELHRLSSEQQHLVGRLLHPTVALGARPLWYQGKALEMMAEFFFERQGADEFFCDRQRRVARERVDRVLAILKRRPSDPPSLEDLGREAGCSPFHLSRIFSKEMGLTIPQYLRQLRMERAAELLRSGRFNVTEAALEAGYSSLSHFTVAFRETFGCCPGLYPLKTSTQAPQATAKE
jgi:AraC family transcriptional regulator